MAPRRILVCLDESKQSVRALEWFLLHLRRASDELHLVTVLAPLTYPSYPIAPVATGAAVAAVTHQWDAQRRAEEHQAAGQQHTPLHWWRSVGRVWGAHLRQGSSFSSSPGVPPRLRLAMDAVMAVSRLSRW